MAALSDRPRGRLAPSPTGALHLGNARSFLLAWLSVRSRGGSLVLRLEDLDHPKVKAGAADAVLEDLRWLGLDWDEGPDIGGPFGPYVQSERTAGYDAALQRLKAAGHVYPCVCTRRDVEQGQSAPHAEEAVPRYAGNCRRRFSDYEEALAYRRRLLGESGVLPSNLLPAWRFHSEGTTEFVDGFQGAQTADVDAADGDFVIARHPQGAGYMLAVVVDDAAMGINEVVRGDDLLPATHRQLHLYRALGLAVPRFMHVPLVVSETGRRLAKRHGDTRLSALRQRGISPEAVVGLLAWWCGWAAWGEAVTPRSLITRYDPSRLPHAPVVLDARIKRWLGL